MGEQTGRAVCVGEALIELKRGGDGRFALSCGGDTFNTAVYLARAGIDAGFATAIGDDPYSDSMLALAAAEGIATNLVLRVPGRLAALCLVESGPGGERNVRYWREAAPVHELFELPDWMRLAEGLVEAKLILFSGITLSRCSRWRGSKAPRWRSTAISGRAAGKAICRAPAPSSSKRSSASTLRCRRSTTKQCYGATPVRKRRWRGCRPSASVRSW